MGKIHKLQTDKAICQVLYSSETVGDIDDVKYTAWVRLVLMASEGNQMDTHMILTTGVTGGDVGKKFGRTQELVGPSSSAEAIKLAIKKEEDLAAEVEKALAQFKKDERRKAELEAQEAKKKAAAEAKAKLYSLYLSQDRENPGGGRWGSQKGGDSQSCHHPLDHRPTGRA